MFVVSDVRFIMINELTFNISASAVALGSLRREHGIMLRSHAPAFPQSLITLYCLCLKLPKVAQAVIKTA